MKQSGQFVVPGEKLGVVEEFLPGPGTYEANGTIYSKLTGLTSVDLKNKTVAVRSSTRTPVVPTEGATVLGVVIHAQDKLATINIAKIGSKVLQNPFTGILHISSSSPRYERNMVDVCKAGDVVRASVVNVKNRVPMLTTAGRGLGVIRAYCSRCGGPLFLTNRRLQCRDCKNIERRRIADDYGRELS